MKQFFLIWMVYSNLSLYAQEELKNIDYIYQDNIRTVLLLPEQTVGAVSSSRGLFKSNSSVSLKGGQMDSLKQRNQVNDIPVIALSGGKIILSFDDLDGDFKYYRYRLVHCNADWTPSALSELEYLQGYSDDRLNNGAPSFGVAALYTNYKLELPSIYSKWTKSGNYLLHVYIDDKDKTPVLTRRFCVYESQYPISARFSRTGLTEKTDTHHELDFTVAYKNLNIRNPQREIKVTVVQNSNWYTAKYNLVPNFNMSGVLTFDYQDSIVFPAGQEFRPFDIRSLLSNRIGVRSIESFKDGYDVTLYDDKPRIGDPYRFYYDINGGFVINNFDFPDIEDPEVRSEYASVLFTYRVKQPYDNYDVYVVSKLTDWQAYRPFKMTYSENQRAYYLDVDIKQGYYDYSYALLPKTGIGNLISEDANWFETEDNYTILVYFRAVGDRYDKLIGYGVFNSLLDRG
ncbi:MAG: DUF5103 domain-containing protein [Saprospiraceae bacterium]